MRVISNTSPLCYSILIGVAHVLPKLFGAVTIPKAVRDELRHPSAPERVRAWMRERPEWLRVETVENGPVAEALTRLHPGEREAILLAEQTGADLIVIDEKVARHMASERGLRLTGLLGVLDEAATQDLIDASVAVERLNQTNFRVAPSLLKSLVDRRV
jgi:predicted nucleic acid-binding protein